MKHLLGIPYDRNSSFLRGAALAPARIRLMEVEGSANSYTESGTDIRRGKGYEDLGDLQFEDVRPEAAHATIREAVKSHLVQGRRILSLGGDHAISFPILEAHAQVHGPVHVLQFDAHADLYDDFDQNPYSHASPFARLLESGQIASLTQVGVRTLTPHQQAQQKRFGVRMVEMRSLTLNFLTALDGPLYVSLDLDVLDPAFAPGVSHHEPGGMSTRQLIGLIQGISVPVIGADLVEYNPARDLHDLTAMTAYKLMKELLDKLQDG